MDEVSCGRKSKLSPALTHKQRSQLEHVHHELFGLVTPRWSSYVPALRAAARCLALLSQEQRLPSSERERGLVQGGEWLVGLLEEAAAQGLEGLREVVDSPDLDLLRARPEFQERLRRLRSAAGAP